MQPAKVSKESHGSHFTKNKEVFGQTKIYFREMISCQNNPRLLKMRHLCSCLCCDKYLYAGLGMLYLQTTSYDKATSYHKARSYHMSSLVGAEVQWSSHPVSHRRRKWHPSVFQAKFWRHGCCPAAPPHPEARLGWWKPCFGASEAHLWNPIAVQFLGGQETPNS